MRSAQPAATAWDRYDERRRFTFTVTDRADADLFIDSLYLPGVSHRRADLARSIVRAAGPADIGIPLRRLEARLLH
jgi:hypothetical protein